MWQVFFGLIFIYLISGSALAECIYYNKTTWVMDLSKSSVRRVGQSATAHRICQPIASSDDNKDDNNVVIEIANTSDKTRDNKDKKNVIFAKKIAVPLVNYYDEVKNGRLHGGAVRAKEVVITTLIPSTLDLGQANRSVRFTDASSGALLAEGTL